MVCPMCEMDADEIPFVRLQGGENMKTGKGLAEYAIAQLGKPYWWGTFGQTANASLLATKRAQYPSYYQANDFQSQFGKKVHDCVGLVKGYRWCDSPDGEPQYVGNQDVAVSGLYTQCDKKGTLASMPDIPGVCVFQADMGHVGVYIGNGEVVEAMGHAHGVVKTKLKDRGWSYWGMPGWLDYGNAGITDYPTTAGTAYTKPTYEYTVKLSLLKYGMGDEQVKTVQRLLIARGYLSKGEDDGKFGPKTLEAVKKFQADNGLHTDGEVGVDTWTKLLKG